MDDCQRMWACCTSYYSNTTVDTTENVSLCQCSTHTHPVSSHTRHNPSVCSIVVPMSRGMAAHCTSVGSRSCISSSATITSRRSGKSVQYFCMVFTVAARFSPPPRLPFSRRAVAVAAERACIPSCCAYLHPICLAGALCSDERAASASDTCVLLRAPPFDAAPPPVQRCSSPEDAIQRISHRARSPPPLSLSRERAR